ncbi:hypothetical protein ACIHFE_19525 [Streptomyces sp. NPDC052396]|uniref:Rv1733c family protein n=1 Tax=Streptomyces sp. NPDC052396 TaxID=3365689 RepID=UPI0037D85770
MKPDHTRSCDRWQHRLRLCLCVLLLGALATVAPLAGCGTYQSRLHTVHSQAAHRHRVTARLAADVPEAPGDGPHWAPVRWTDRRGAERSTIAEVPDGAARGDPVTVWVDHTGQAARPPMSPRKALAAGWTAGVVCAGGLVLAFGACWAGLNAGFDRVRYARWAREWQTVEPKWSRELLS